MKAMVAVGLTIALITGGPALAQGMCQGTGERVSGFNKICSYDCLGSPREITRRSTDLCPLSIQAPAMPSITDAPAVANRAGGLMCQKAGERSSGFSKICTYDCLGSETSITINSVSLCPLNVRR